MQCTKNSWLLFPPGGETSSHSTARLPNCFFLFCFLGLPHTEICPCDTGPQTPEHVLQSFPLPHTEICPCDTGPQTMFYSPAPCHTQKTARAIRPHRPQSMFYSPAASYVGTLEARLQHWPNWTTPADKLSGSKEDLNMLTTNFINGTGLRI